MLNQAELSCYGFNPHNIIQRENRGYIKVSLHYDAKNKLYVVTRKTTKTIWQDRYKDLEKAKTRYNEYLYSSNAQLEARLVY